MCQEVLIPLWRVAGYWVVVNVNLNECAMACIVSKPRGSKSIKQSHKTPGQADWTELNKNCCQERQQTTYVINYVHILLFPTSLLQPGCKPRRQTSNGAVFGREEKLSKRSGCCLTFPHQVSTHVQIDFETHHPFRISSLVLRDLHKFVSFNFSIRNPSKPHLMPTAVDVGLGRLPSGHPGAIFLASFPPPKRRRQQINIGATISCHYGWGREGSSSV